MLYISASLLQQLNSWSNIRCMMEDNEQTLCKFRHKFYTSVRTWYSVARIVFDGPRMLALGEFITLFGGLGQACELCTIRCKGYDRNLTLSLNICFHQEYIEITIVLYGPYLPGCDYI